MNYSSKSFSGLYYLSFFAVKSLYFSGKFKACNTDFAAISKGRKNLWVCLKSKLFLWLLSIEFIVKYNYQSVFIIENIVLV
jgi:hypothetical protein